MRRQSADNRLIEFILREKSKPFIGAALNPRHLSLPSRDTPSALIVSDLFKRRQVLNSYQI